MKFLQLFSLLFLLIISSCAKEKKKTIMDIFALEEGCPLPEPGQIIGKEEMAMIEVEEDVPPFDRDIEPPKPKEINYPSEEEWKTKLQDYLKAANLPELSISFDEQKFEYGENKLWALVASDGEKITPHIFQKVNPVQSKSFFFGLKKDEFDWNLYNRKGEALLSRNIKSYSHYPHQKDFFIIKEKGKQGVGTFDGEIIIEPLYEYIQPANDCWIVKNDDRFGVVDSLGRELVPIKFKGITQAKTNDKVTFFLVQEDNDELTIYKRGRRFEQLGIKYKNHHQGQIINQRYFYYDEKIIDLVKNVYLFCGENFKLKEVHGKLDFFIFEKSKNHWVINAKGELVFDGKVDYSNGIIFIEGVAVVPLVEKDTTIMKMSFKKNKVGIINDSLRWVVQPEYDYIKRMHQGNIYLAQKDRKMGVIDAKGNPIIPFDFYSIKNMGDRFVAFTNKEQSYVNVFDLEGEKLIEKEITVKELASKARGYQGRTKDGNKRVLLNRQFEIIYEGGFNNVNSIGDSLVWIEDFGSPNQYYLIHDDGTPYDILVDGKPRHDYKKVGLVYKTNFAVATLSDNKKYYHNLEFNTTTPLADDVIGLNGELEKSHGLIKMVFKNGDKKMVGMIDRQGNEILPLAFDNVWKTFHYLVVKYKNRHYFFDRKGEEVFTEYDKVDLLSNGNFKVTKDGKVGMLNNAGKVILPIEYLSLVQQEGRIEVTHVSGEKMRFSFLGEKL